jgi:CheY-like chemotaxis protein
LGLTIVQDVVRRHGGWIECSSAVGRGTCFSVYLPPADLAATDVAAPGHPSPTPHVTATSPTVLLADNDPCILALCRTILESNGYRVHATEDGREAAEVYRREKGRIGVVLLDQNMPGMSGRDVLAELSAVDPRVRVIFMSGAPVDDVPPKSRANLCWVLNKPFRPADLLDAVRNALAAGR